MKTIDNFLDIEIANKIYANLVKKFRLSEYRSHCFYDSNKDDPSVCGFIRNLAPNMFPKHSGDFHVYGNSFLEKSRNIGPHFPSCFFKKHGQLMLCRQPFIGGEIIFPTQSWNVGDAQNNEGITVPLRHNKYIQSNTSEQRTMNFISVTKHPVIYLNILY
jgi:hypothetical protein